ncbi:MAG: thioredoxin family protein [Planctomycetes bacterium]|nr:thioredoxin family protein [Planctomycetota bacterium]
MLANKELLKSSFDKGLDYDRFVALGEPQGHRPPWDDRYSLLELTSEQDALVKSFTREMNVLCLTGTWCGDCALQGSAMVRIAQANPEKIHLRYVLRCDEFADLVVKAQINAGFRVPITWFMAEDFETVAVIGDRTLSRYRSIAASQLAPGGVLITAPKPENPVREVLAEVLDEFERCQLILRTSARLRQKHGD